MSSSAASPKVWKSGTRCAPGVIAATLSDHVRASDAVFIMGHKFSDLDSMGAAVGLWSAVN